MSRVGRNWKVFSHGVVDKKSKVIIVSNMQLPTIDQGTLEEMRLISEYMDGMKMGVMKVPYLSKYCK
jgi:hypothetical protein